jgi:hypothetical protein
MKQKLARNISAGSHDGIPATTTDDRPTRMHAINELPPIIDPDALAPFVRVLRATRAAKIYDQVE